MGWIRLDDPRARMRDALLATATLALPLLVSSCPRPPHEGAADVGEDAAIAKTVEALQPQADPDLLGYWNFDETSGAIALDASGHSSHGQITNATRDPNGRSGGALYFNGTNARVAVPDGAWNVGTPVTYSFWYKNEASPTGNVIDHRLTGTLAGSFAFRPLEFSGASYDSVRFAAYDSVSGNVGSSLRGPSAPGVWTMMTIVVTTSQIQVYKNGALMGTSAITGGLPKIAGSLYIGARGEVPDGFFKGWVDEVGVYGRAMTSAEVTALYQSYGPLPPLPWAATGLVGHWKLDEGSGTVAGDSSGFGNNGTLLGNAQWAPNGISGSCLRFDGTNSLVRIPDGVWDQAGNITYIVWYKNDPTPAAPFLFEHEFGSNIRGVFHLRSNNPAFGAYDSSWTPRPSAASWTYTSPPANQWRMLAVNFRQTEARVYSNGTYLGTTPLEGGVPYYPGRLFFGGRGSVPDNYFRGWIDEVSIYARSLSAAEIAALYQDTIAPPEGLGNGEGVCWDNSNCADALTCGEGIGPLFGYAADDSVCWDPTRCGTLPRTDCGTPTSYCGDTCCIPSCGAASTPDGCGGVCQPCVEGADTDADGLLDCDEREDGDDWTDPLIFNGVEATLNNACNASPTCAQIDTLAEVNACVDPLEHTSLHSGWDFFTDEVSVCEPGFGFDVNWQQCNSDFAVHATGTIRFVEGGLQCFGVEGSTTKQCAALFVNGQPVATTAAGQQCIDLAAGAYPIEWLYETTSHAVPNRLRLSYCHGGDGECTAQQPIPSDMLRVGSDTTSRLCASPGECTELCPCGVGKICSSNDTCAPGLECRTGFAQYFGQPGDAAVCWDPTCDDQSAPSYECGSVSAKCGLCSGCQPDCTGKTCGSDGCTGSCGDVCGAGEAGCQSDLDCEPGLTCGADNGPRFGLPAGTRVCWPATCEALDQSSIPCGTPSDPCGTCPACVPDCSEPSCTSDGCGGTCLTCPTGSQCQESSGACYMASTRRFPLPTDVHVNTAAVGTLGGKFDVSGTGDATYTVPLPLPPGRGGIEPSLSLRYDSSKGNGYLGLGWSLEGLSAISRCNKTIAQDGAASVPTFAVAPVEQLDAYCLDGQRLVGTSLTFTDSDHALISFLTEDNRFTRVTALFEIESRGETAFDLWLDGPESFTAYAKDGRVFYYGTTDSARILQPARISPEGGTPGPSPVQTWALSYIKDRTGLNTMYVRYVHRTVQTSEGFAREYYPLYITYGPYQDPIAVRFTYSSDPELHDTRSDPKSVWRYGVNLQVNDLLRRVSVEVDGAPVQHYNFGFADSTQNGGTHSRLATITRCTGDFVCMPATTLEYDLPNRHLSSGPQLGVHGQPKYLHVLDMNGDGIDDVLYADDVIDDSGDFSYEHLTNWSIALSKRENDLISFTRLPSSNTIYHTSATFPFSDETTYGGFGRGGVLDWDNDGRQDLIEYQYDKCGDDGCGEIDEYQVLTFDGQELERHDTGIPHARKGTQYLIDTNGDRLKDLLVCDRTSDGPRWRLYKHHGGAEGYDMSTGNAPGFTEEDRLDLEVDAQCLRGQVLDRDGDGAEELLFPADPDGSGRVTWLMFDAADRPSFAVSNASLRGAVVMLDVNGDGLRDLVAIGDDDGANESWTVATELNRGNGSFDFSLQDTAKSGRTAELPGHVFPFDADGDGRDDLVVDPHDGRGAGGDWFAWLSMGSGFRAVLELGTDTPDLRNGGIHPADLNGDGVPGLLAGETTVGHGFHVRESQSGPPREVLEKITDGLGARTLVQYEPLTNPAVYTSTLLDSDGQTACRYPLRCEYPKGYAVSLLTEYDAPDLPYPLTPSAARRYRYKYTGARTDALGRGDLGFSSVEWSQENINDGSVIRARQSLYANETREDDLAAYPYAYRPYYVKDTTYVDGVQYSTITETTLDIQRTASNLRPSSFSVYPKYVLTTRFTYEPATDAFDVLGTTAREVLDRDMVGNDRQVLWNIDDGAETKLIEREFKHDDPAVLADWLIDLPTLEIETDTVAYPAVLRERRVERDYDAHGLLEHETRAPFDPENELTTTYERNLAGLVTKVTQTAFESEARTTEIKYDALAEYPKTITNALHQDTQVEFDRVFGMLTAVQDPNDLLTQYATDGFGRPALEIEPDGVTTTHAYSYGSVQRPLVMETTREGGARERRSFDVRQRMREQTTWALDGKELEQRFTYDRQGRLATRTRPTVPTATPAPGVAYTYDNLGRVMTQTAAGVETVHYCHDVRTDCALNPRGFTACQLHDERGRVVKVLDPIVGTCEDGLEDPWSRAGISYTYGPFNDLSMVTDQEGHETEIVTDNWSNNYLVSDPDVGVTYYGHNGFGESTFVSNANGRTEFEHDPLGRRTVRRDVDLNGAGQHGITTWTWDGGASTDPSAGELIGYLTETQSSDGAIRRLAYDTATGYLVRSEDEIEGHEYEVVLGRDGFGRVEQLTYPAADGLPRLVIENDYDDYGHLKQIRRSGSTQPTWQASQTDDHGQLSVETFGDGTWSAWAYDDHGRVSGQGNFFALSTVLQNIEYGYDANGNLDSRDDLVRATHEFFAYDEFDRLSYDSTYAQTFDYDAIGNLSLGPDTRYHWWQPHALEFDGEYDYEHDDVGNRTVKKKDGFLERASYTRAGKLSRLWQEDEDGEVTTETLFKYDSDQRRIKKSGPSGTTIYVGDLFERRAAAGGAIEHVHYITNGSRVVAQITSSSGHADLTQHIHADRLGSTTLVTDAVTGVQEFAFEPYGGARSVDGQAAALSPSAVGISRGFTGHEQDDELGLVNMNGRIYDPQTRQFTSPDPYVIHPFHAMGLNRYAYVFGNPYKYVDPTGYDGVIEVGPFVITSDPMPPPPPPPPPDNTVVIEQPFVIEGYPIAVDPADAWLVNGTPAEPPFWETPLQGQGVAGPGAPGSDRSGRPQATQQHGPQPQARSNRAGSAKMINLDLLNYGKRYNLNGWPEAAAGVTVGGQVVVPGVMTEVAAANFQLATNDESGVYMVRPSAEAKEGGGRLAGAGVSWNFAVGEDGATWDGLDNNFQVVVGAYSFTAFWSADYNAPAYIGLDVGVGPGGGVAGYTTNYIPVWDVNTQYEPLPASLSTK